VDRAPWVAAAIALLAAAVAVWQAKSAQDQVKYAKEEVGYAKEQVGFAKEQVGFAKKQVQAAEAQAESASKQLDLAAKAISVSERQLAELQLERQSREAVERQAADELLARTHSELAFATYDYLEALSEAQASLGTDGRDSLGEPDRRALERRVADTATTVRRAEQDAILAAGRYSMSGGDSAAVSEQRRGLMRALAEAGSGDVQRRKVADIAAGLRSMLGLRQF
jgi:chromosome segregation ATPase